MASGPAAREARFVAVCQEAARLMQAGVPVFSPIAHTHPIAVHGGLPSGFDFWAAYDLWLLERCAELWVLELEGWTYSRGIAAEREMARALGVPIRHIKPGAPVPEMEGPDE